MVPLYHPLVRRLADLTACGLRRCRASTSSATSTKFFQNGAHAGRRADGAPAYRRPTAKRLKEHWETNYSGDNAGKVAVLGDGLKFEQMAMKAVDAQMIEQLKWTAETVCSTASMCRPTWSASARRRLTTISRPPTSSIIRSACRSSIDAIELCSTRALA
jgi:hypothetical protein